MMYILGLNPGMPGEHANHMTTKEYFLILILQQTQSSTNGNSQL